MTKPKKKPATKARPPALSSYPVPDADAVERMSAALFSGRFVDDHLSALLARASVMISAEFHEDVRRHRMPIPHWRILATLSHGDAMAISELAELTVIKQPTITRVIQRMEALGLLHKRVDKHDRRVTRVTLTKAGRERVDELLVLAAERQKRILHGLDAEGLKAALRYLIAFCAAKRDRARPPG